MLCCVLLQSILSLEDTDKLVCCKIILLVHFIILLQPSYANIDTIGVGCNKIYDRYIYPVFVVIEMYSLVTN